MIDCVIVVGKIVADAVVPATVDKTTRLTVPAQLSMSLAVQLFPLDGTDPIRDSVQVTQPVTTDAVTWKTTFLTEIMAWAASQAGGNAYNVVRVMGFVAYTFDPATDTVS